MKTCRKCGRSKTPADFSRRTVSPDGLSYTCKQCDLQAKSEAREYYKSRSDEEIEAAAAARGPRACRKCKEVKGPELYPRDRGRRDGRGTMCLTCSAETVAHYRNVVDPEAYRARKKAEFGRNRETYRRYKLKKHFGITWDDYWAMHAEQGGVCAICGKPEREVRQSGFVIDLAVDHDHDTGAVRGLLCATCNKGLGYFRDSPVLLARAARYITEHLAIQQHLATK